MKELDQQTERLQPDRWTFTGEEIAGLFHKGKIEPWAGSPLIQLKPSSTAKPPGLKTDDISKVNDAILRISRPDIILGMLHYPPETPDVTWFYGVAEDKNFAVYRKGSGDDHHIVWPVSDKSLMKILEAALSISEPATIDSFSLTMNRAGFEAMVAIVDLIQEETLFAAMNRQQERLADFTLAQLFECYKRSLLGLDFRWMVQRAKLFSPSRIMPEPEYLRVGLNSLIEQQMLVPAVGRYSLTQRFYTACSLMGACSGFCGLSTRRLKSRPDGKAVWDHEHVAALRGTGSLWLFDFSQISTSDFIVRFGDVTPGLLQERLRAGMLTPPKPSKPLVAPPATTSATAETIRCSRCGTELSPQAKFCSNCGTPVGKVAAPAPPPSPPRKVCPRCDAKLSPQVKFCTNCGSPVT